MLPPQEMVDRAVRVGASSPCAKSKRGVVVWSGRLVYTQAFNAPAMGGCDGSAACRRDCGKICIHAEQAALIKALPSLMDFDVHMLHIKVVDGQPVAGGPPSCAECSKLILACGIDFMWLLEEAASRFGADGRMSNDADEIEWFVRSAFYATRPALWGFSEKSIDHRFNYTLNDGVWSITDPVSGAQWTATDLGMSGNDDDYEFKLVTRGTLSRSLLTRDEIEGLSE